MSVVVVVACPLSCSGVEELSDLLGLLPEVHR